MKYSLIRTYPNDSMSKNANVQYYTYVVLETLARNAGHTVVQPDGIDKDTIILVNITTCDGISPLITIRQKYPKHIIVVGGHWAVHTPTLLLWADYVNVGQGFDFFKAQSLNEIRRLKSVDYKGKDEVIIPSDFIDWEQVPLVNDSKRHFYYWGGVGCQNKCKYCFTSWTNRHQTNRPDRVIKAVRYVTEKRCTITITSNEYTYQVGADVRDMMLKDFVKTPMAQGKPKLIRLGVEFATEEMRRKTGKFFTDEQYALALEKAAHENKELQLFFITGAEPIPVVKEFVLRNKDIRFAPRIFHKFTNLVYSQFTPFFKRKRFDITLRSYAKAGFKCTLPVYSH